jgi:predicted metal-dependent peptidase
MNPEDSLTAEDKISRARAQIGREAPFFGAHALAMNFQETDGKTGISTMATDYHNLYWYRPFVDTLSTDEVKGVIIHEVLHRIFMHPFRLRGRIHTVSNMAMDYAINPYITDMRCKLPKGCLDDKKYHSKTWEQIYQMLLDQMQQNGKDPQNVKGQGWGDVVSPKGADGKELSESEAKAAEMSAESQNRAMLQSAKMAGHVPGNLQEIIDEMYEPEIDYEEIIYKVFTGGTPSGYSMRRPNKSALHNFNLFASGRNKRGAGVVGVGFDTSGSITTVEAANVLGILNGVMQSTMPEKVVVIQFDHGVQHVEEYDGFSDIPSIQIHGRGGTDFSPQFDYIEKNCMNIDQYLVITDGYGPFPKNPPSFPVTWLMTTDVVAPFGTTVRFKVKG